MSYEGSEAQQVSDNARAEIDRQIDELKGLELVEKNQKVESKRQALEDQNIDTTQMSPEEIITHFVSNETKTML